MRKNKLTLNEDFDRNREPAWPVSVLTRNEVMRAVANIRKGGFISMGYVKPISLQARYQNGYDKRSHTEYPLVRVIKLLEDSGVTGISYSELKAVKERNAQTPEQVEDAISELTPQERTKEIVPTDWVVKNIVERFSNGNEAVDYYPLRRRAYKRYYISIDGEDYRETTKDEIIQYMTPSEIDKEFNKTYDEPIGTYGQGSKVNFNYRIIGRIYKLDKMGDLILKKDRTKNKLERDPVEVPEETKEEETQTESLKESFSTMSKINYIKQYGYNTFKSLPKTKINEDNNYRYNYYTDDKNKIIVESKICKGN